MPESRRSRFLSGGAGREDKDPSGRRKAARMRKKADSWTVLSVFILALFVLFLAAPLFSLLLSGLRDRDGWTLRHLQRFFGKRYYTRALLNSLSVSSCVTLLTLLIGD